MIQVLHRALDIIENVANNNEKPLLMGEIANKMDLKPSTCANIVKTLLERGYLKRAEQQKGYQLGPNIFKLTKQHDRNQERLLKASEIVLNQLSNEIEENCLVATLNHNQRIIINHKISNQVVQAITPNEKYAYDSSTGRLLIALLPADELNKHIKMFGFPSPLVWPEIKDENAFHKEVNKIKERGYLFLEDSIQIVGFAAPIIIDGKTIAALSIYVPAFRFTPQMRKAFIEKGLAAAKRIADSLS